MTFAQLLEAGYTIEEAVAFLDNHEPSARDLDQEQAARDGEDWWKK